MSADPSEGRERARFDDWWNAARAFVFNTPELAARSGFEAGRRSLEQERDEAVSWIRIVGEELVLAGYPAGDRTVILANIRAAVHKGDS